MRVSFFTDNRIRKRAVKTYALGMHQVRVVNFTDMLDNTMLNGHRGAFIVNT